MAENQLVWFCRAIQVAILPSADPVSLLRIRYREDGNAIVVTSQHKNNVTSIRLVDTTQEEVKTILRRELGNMYQE